MRLLTETEQTSIAGGESSGDSTGLIFDIKNAFECESFMVRENGSERTISFNNEDGGRTTWNFQNDQLTSAWQDSDFYDLSSLKIDSNLNFSVNIDGTALQTINNGNDIQFTATPEGSNSPIMTLITGNDGSYYKDANMTAILSNDLSGIVWDNEGNIANIVKGKQVK